jgi:death-on-curing family protein
MARPLNLREAEFIAHAAVVELMNYDSEPIPPFHTRSPGMLESCLSEPFQTFAGKDLYPSFSKKAAVLFYLVIKNHPFQNGNKRMSIVLAQVFCYVNKKWLDIPPDKLYQIAITVAESEAKDKESVVKTLEKAFKQYTKPRSFIERLINSGK